LVFNEKDMGYGFGWVVCRHRVTVLANASPDRWKADPDRLARKLANIYLRGQGLRTINAK